MVTFSWCWKQISFADQIGAGVLFIPGWFDIALNDFDFVLDRAPCPG
jgi:hypothetical protein